MNASRFLDTNILLYAYDLDAPAKRAAALRLVEQGWTAPRAAASSVQVEQARWEISLWDALILVAARASGASELITEDLSHGQNYGGVKVVNPFL